MWYRKKIAKSKGPVHVKQMLSVHAAASGDNIKHNDEMPFYDMSTVDKQTERTDMTEYQKLGERQISKTPDTYQTIRVL